MIENIQAFLKRKQGPKKRKFNNEIVKETGYSYIALNKQKATPFVKETGFVTVNHLLPNIDGLKPVGFNDNVTEGVVLFTNDNSLDIEHIEIEFVVKVDKVITPMFMKQLNKGAMVKAKMLKPLHVEKINTKHIRLTMYETMNDQVNLLLSTLGYQAVRIMRVRVGSIVVNDMRKREWRYLSLEEIKSLRGESNEYRV